MIILKIIGLILKYPFRIIVMFAAIITLSRDKFKPAQNLLEDQDISSYFKAGGDFMEQLLKYYSNTVPVVLQYAPGVLIIIWAILRYGFDFM